jgi:hypothetical protein
MTTPRIPTGTARFAATGFAAFGLLVGYITGITSSAIANTVVLTLFTFIGGKFFIDLTNKNALRARLAGVALGCFSIFFLVGLNAGIVVKVNDLLTFAQTRKRQEAKAAKEVTDSTLSVLLPYLKMQQDKPAFKVKYLLSSKPSVDSAVDLYYKGK